jgi:photosystem II stability/assembly factor-like uncharacterized protein
MEQHRRCAGRLPAVIAFLPTLLATPLLAGSFRWSSQGPWGGPISAVASAPSDPQVAYAATPFGYVFRSHDGGLHWETRHHIAFSFVQALAIDPRHPDVVYAAHGFGLYKSVDGGESWSSNLRVGSRAVAIDAGDPDVLYVGASSGELNFVFRSPNAGMSWNDVTHELAGLGVNAIVVNPAPVAAVIVGTSGGVFRSEDSGESWLPSSEGLTDTYVQSLVDDPADPAVFYAGTGSGGVFKSVDGGTSWSSSNAGLPGLNVYALLVSPGAVFAAVASYGIYRSTDAGASWTRADSGVPEPVLANSLALGGPGQDVFVGTPRGLYRTSDLGASWAASHEELAGNIANSVAVSPSSSLLAAGTGTGFYLSDDEGRTWRNPGNVGLGAAPVSSVVDAAFDPQDEATMYASVDPCCGVYTSSDAGLLWGLTALRGSFWDLVVDPSDSSTVYALGESAPFKTTDGGDFWEPVRNGIPETLSMTAFSMDPNDPTRLFAATTSVGQPSPDDGVYRSTNGGGSWEHSNEGLGHAFVYEFAVASSDSQRVYAATGDGVFVSNDGGSSWTGGEHGGYSIAVDPADAGTIYVGTIQDGILRSRDRGTSWQSMNAGLPGSVAVYSLALNAAGSVLYAGTTLGVFDYRMSFQDVLSGDPFYEPVQTLALNLLTTGCGQGNFCPSAPLTRAQAAVWLLKAKNGSDYNPPPASGAVFPDVPANAFAAAWIEELALEGIAGGCGGGNFCPDAATTRAQMAVLLLRAKHGPTYEPPPATGLVFADVPADAFAAAWIEALAAEGISAGCGSGIFCPGAVTTRAQAAALLARTFTLE